MRSYSLSHLSDADLVHDLTALVARERHSTAALLAHLAEVDERKLYRPAAYPSMLEYCVGELKMSEDAARKRIHAAHVARRFPVLFAAISDGQLHLSGVITLAPVLTAQNVDQVIAAATHKTRAEIEQLRASWAPQLDQPSEVRAVEVASPARGEAQSASSCAPGRILIDPAKHAITPIGPQRFSFTTTIDESLNAKVRYAKELLSHQLPSGDLARLLDLALDALIAKLEKRRFAATERPKARPRMPRAKGRRIPAAIQREVWKRDGGQCTFTSPGGHRCTSRTRLEFDHVLEVARGGESTADNLRLRCRVHNQFTAEQTFGAVYMERKRREAREQAPASAPVS